MADFDPRSLCGWVDHPDRLAFAAQFPKFAQIAPKCMASVGAETEPILLYKAFHDVLGAGAWPSWVPQKIGDCESFGHGHGNDCLQCVEISLGEASEYRETMTEQLYGAGRKIGNMLGPFDGCYGAAMVKAMQQTGMVSRDMVPDGAYSGQRAKQWGRTGPPADVEQKALGYKLGNAAMVTTWDELVAAVKNGYPVTLSSGMGYSMTRDSQGFCSRRGRWGHCTVVLGVRFDRPGALIQNSWGEQGMYAGPLVLDQPPGSFWADQSNVVSMMSEQDSFALSGSPAFAARKLPPHWSWSVAA
jgi:hypothetical protein